MALLSPNGSVLNLSTASTPTLAGCLKSCRAVALAAGTYGHRIAVIPAGATWNDGRLRPAFEDWIGDGAIVSYLKRHLSPEAELAQGAYQNICQSSSSLRTLRKRCSSGQELVERGFGQDVDLASEIKVSNCVPSLKDGAYKNVQRADLPINAPMSWDFDS